MQSVQFMSQTLLDSVSEMAKASARQRKNQNFHLADQDICHRLLNALEPETYIPPHRHLHLTKGESIVILRGRVGAVFFDAKGQITQHCILQPGGEIMGVDIAPGTFHSLVALETGTVFFEAKAGPYTPVSPDERASFAPDENTPDAVAFLAGMKRQLGEKN